MTDIYEVFFVIVAAVIMYVLYTKGETKVNLVVYVAADVEVIVPYVALVVVLCAIHIGRTEYRVFGGTSERVAYYALDYFILQSA